MKDNKSKDVSPTIQETNPVSENNSPDTIEMLYIESPGIGLVEFRRRLEQLIKEEVDKERFAAYKRGFEQGQFDAKMNGLTSSKRNKK